MGAEIQHLSIPEAIRLEIQKHPSLVLVRTVTDSESLLERNKIHGDPYLHGVSLFVGLSKPDYDPDQMTDALDKVLKGLKPYAYRGHAVGARLYTSMWGSTILIPAHFWLDEPMGTRVETSTWVFNPANSVAKDAMAQAGMEEGQEYTTTMKRPVHRQISTMILPSVQLADLAATCEEMNYLTGDQKRPYSFKHPGSLYNGPLDMKDVEELQRNPSYVQTIADRSFTDYKVLEIS